MKLTVTGQTQDTTARLALTGELDMATTDRLADAVADAARPPTASVVLDLAGLTFCDATGVHALVNARRLAQRRGVQFDVVNPQGLVLKVLQVCGVLETLAPMRAPGQRAAGARRVPFAADP